VIEYLMGGAVIVFLIVLVVGGLTGRVQAQGCTEVIANFVSYTILSWLASP
jgi:hypothetical protein